MQPTPWGFFLFSFSVPIRPLAVSCVPSDPECSRPPGALSPRSTFISDRCAGWHSPAPTSSKRQPIAFINGQSICSWPTRLRDAHHKGLGNQVTPHRSHVVSPRCSQPLPCRLPTLPPTAPMSFSHVTPNHPHVVSPRCLQPLACVVFPRYPQPLPCRLPALPPATSMSSPHATPSHFHVVSPRYLQPLPCRPRTTRRRYLIDTGGTLHGSMRPTP